MKDRTLLNQLQVALNANDDAAILDLAAKHGYSFSQKSLRLGLKNIANLIAPIAILEQG